MDAKRARPLAAFFLVALLCAVVMIEGMQATGVVPSARPAAPDRATPAQARTPGAVLEPSAPQRPAGGLDFPVAPGIPTAQVTTGVQGPAVRPAGVTAAGSSGTARPAGGGTPPGPTADTTDRPSAAAQTTRPGAAEAKQSSPPGRKGKKPGKRPKKAAVTGDHEPRGHGKGRGNLSRFVF